MKNSYSILIVISFFTLFIFESCDKDEKVVIPSYIFVKPFKLQTINNSTAQQGDTSHQILDVWVYIDEGGQKFLGSYGLPALIPIQKTGKTILRFAAGVKHSGQEFQRIVYPFYDDYIDTLNLEVLKTDTVEPVVNYSSNITFSVEDYDDNTSSSYSIFKSNSYHLGDTLIKINDTRSWKEGKNSALLKLSDSSYQLDYISNVKNGLPMGSPIYLEVDYKCNTTFQIGLVCKTTQGDFPFSVLVVYPNNKWNKLYLDLTDDISSKLNKYGWSTGFQIDFQITKHDTQTPELFLDNIKLIYR